MSRQPKGNSIYTTRALSFDELGVELIEKWKQLDSETHVANPFLSCGFVLSFLKNRPPHQQPVFLICQCRQSGKLLGMGVFHQTRATKTLPLPHLIPFQCEYALRHGFLIAEGATSEFLSSLLDYMNHHQDRWFGIEFPELRLEQEWVTQLHQQASSTGLGCSFRLRPVYESPVVDLLKLNEKELESNWSASRRKTMRRNLKRLNKRGKVEFRIITDEKETPAALERFLVVEGSGWKKNLGTSLSSQQADSDFVKSMVAELATQHRVFISELRVENDVAASAINLISGTEMFAFKIGFNENYAEASPGVLHEMHLAEHVCEHFPQITRIDGCAKADSYLNQIWPDRIVIGEGLLSVSKLARGTGKLLSKIRLFKRWVAHLLEK